MAHIYAHILIKPARAHMYIDVARLRVSVQKTTPTAPRPLWKKYPYAPAADNSKTLPCAPHRKSFGRKIALAWTVQTIKCFHRGNEHMYVIKCGLN